ncbi:MAG: helix-turn-helix transcriptional regulator [Clostridia bacterium]|nr:helix-turn-helix transcriptional regulator [Clostridia bacterium]
MKHDYITHAGAIFYKHERSEHISEGAFTVHTHNTYELIYFLGGNATHVIEDRKYKLKKGDMILVRPFQHHYIQIDSQGDYERYDILFDPDRDSVEGVRLLGEDLEVINLSDNARAREIFEKMDFYRKSCDDEMFGRLLSHLLSELFCLLYLFPKPSAETSPSVSPLISKALHFINENLDSIRDIEEISSHLFISQSYLFRLFRQELHQTPKKYITEKRLYLAQQLLSAGEKPTSVFRRCGFQDYTTFYRNYTAFFGDSPSEDR